MSLKKKSFWGIIWNSSSSISLAGLNFIITAILARLLSPNAFGVMGMIYTTIALINMMNQFGLSPAIIQGDNLNQKRLSSLFWFNMLIGFVMTLLIFFTSESIALFFKQESLSKLLKMISIVFTVVSFSFIQRSLLKKEMKFKELFQIKLVSTICYGIITIILAMNGFGVKSLVIGYIIKNIIISLLVHIYYTWYPNLTFSFKLIKDLLDFGVYVFGSSLLNYFNRNLDYILIGRFLGPNKLGYYILAYKLMLVPVRKIAGVINQTFLPAFSKIKNNIQKVKDYYLKLLELIALISFPMMGGLFIVAPEFILTVYGVKWIPVIFLVQFLWIAGASQSLGTTGGIIFYSQGKSKLSFKWNIFTVVNMTLIILLGLSLGGIKGLAIALAVSSIYCRFLQMKIIGNVINMSLYELLKKIYKPFLYTLFMIIIVYLAKNYFILNILDSQTIKLIINILIGVIAYGSIFLIFDGKKYLKQIKNTIK